MLRRIIIGLAVGAALLAPALAAEPAGLAQSPAVPTPIVQAPVMQAPAVPPGGEGGPANPRLADSASCASACQAAHDRCRVATKGSPSCDVERQACLERCLRKRQR